MSANTVYVVVVALAENMIPIISHFHAAQSTHTVPCTVHRQSQLLAQSLAKMHWRHFELFFFWHCGNQYSSFFGCGIQSVLDLAGTFVEQFEEIVV
jgi:hypothetical protein